MLGACAPAEVKVGKVNLVEADGVEPAAEGTVVEVPGEIPRSLSGPIRLAIDRDVTYADALKAIKAVKAAGGTPVLLAIQRNRVVAIPEIVGGAASDKAVRLKARTDASGCDAKQPQCVQACVSPPDNEEATCVRRPEGLHVDRAFVRQLLARAISEWSLTDVHVWVDPKLSWADAVRAIDGARTCCGEGKVKVTVEPAP